MRKILLFALFALSFSACQKNTELSKPAEQLVIDPIDNGPKTDKQLVDSVIITGKGDIIINYKYDGNNRMTEMHQRVSGNAPGISEDHIYTYDASGNLIKSTITRTGVVTIFDYTYTDGVPTLVVYNEPGNASNSHTIGISVQNGAAVGNTINTPSGESAAVSYSYTDGNKTSEINESYSPDHVKTATLSFTDQYGSKKNPYTYSGNKWVLPDVPFANKNELSKEIANSNGSLTTDLYIYTYNKQGYPATAEKTRLYGNVVEHSTLRYKYIDAK